DRARDEELSDDDDDDDDDDEGTAEVADDEDTTRGRTRYERKSAKLPSMGEDASKVVGSLEGFRKSLRGA
ncbi:MAG: hypothetical protein IIC70_13325, partial [Acidobacteria bacterium]|nr:hypothetical protein [Acidobacteriota bacterium]